MKFVLEIDTDGDEYQRDLDGELGRNLIGVKESLRRGYASGTITGSGGCTVGVWRIKPGTINLNL